MLIYNANIDYVKCDKNMEKINLCVNTLENDCQYFTHIGITSSHCMTSREPK